MGELSPATSAMVRKVVRFSANEKIGMTFVDGGRVTIISKSSQAERNGVKVGWTIESVEDEMMRNCSFPQITSKITSCIKSGYNNIKIAFLLDKMIEFAGDSKIGLTVEDGGVVSRVEYGSQAHNLGVVVGWKITTVNKDRAKNAPGSIRKQIRRASINGTPISIGFETLDVPAIPETHSFGEEKLDVPAVGIAAEIEGETERADEAKKTPVEGSSPQKQIVKVPRKFPQRLIDYTVDDVSEWVKSCESLKGINPDVPDLIVENGINGAAFQYLTLEGLKEIGLTSNIDTARLLGARDLLMKAPKEHIAMTNWLILEMSGAGTIVATGPLIGTWDNFKAEMCRIYFPGIRREQMDSEVYAKFDFVGTPFHCTKNFQAIAHSILRHFEETGWIFRGTSTRHADIIMCFIFSM